MASIYIIAPETDSQTNYPRMEAQDGRFVTQTAAISLTTVAALAPEDFQVRLCDENIDAVDFDAPEDVIAITANVSQARRAIAFARCFRARGKTVLMGGPHVSLAPHLFEGEADSIVAGELESIAADVFADARAGRLKPRYDAPKADLAASPAPRWDLYPNERALHAVVQTSRGCPFECNFCDVIQYLGRVQRHKTPEQVIGELQTIYDLGYGHVALADDNFTVYRKRCRALLEAIRDWNGADGRGYVTMATQMSIDIARDDDILQLCAEAGVHDAFIGVESVNPDSLQEAQKRQNLNVDLVAQLSKIVGYGLRIETALMVGFDHDDTSIFQRQLEFCESVPVTGFNISTLVAPVATPLYDRIKAEGRLIGDEISAQFPGPNLVTNFQPAQMSVDELYVGARWLVNRVLSPDFFLSRFEHLARVLGPNPFALKGVPRHRHESRRLAHGLYMRTLRAVMRAEPDAADAIGKAMAIIRRADPAVRDGLSDALSHYVLTVAGFRRRGLYDPEWAKAAAPPFGSARASDRLATLETIAAAE